MKFKFASVSTIVVIAAVLSTAAFAEGKPTPNKKKSAPSLPYPPQQQQPTIPGFPTDPTKPTLPDIPTPGPNEGPEVPFPLDATLPFPWSTIQGTWRVELNAVHLLFSFNVQIDYKGKQYLHVVQIDHSTGDVLAEGVGVGVSNDKLVRAAMNPKHAGDSAYMLFVGNYRNTPGYTVRGQVTTTVTVLTVRSFSDLLGDHDAQVIVTKVSNTPYQAQKSLPKPIIAY